MSSDDLKKIFDESIDSTKAYFISKVQQKYPRLGKRILRHGSSLNKWYR